MGVGDAKTVDLLHCDDCSVTSPRAGGARKFLTPAFLGCAPWLQACPWYSVREDLSDFNFYLFFHFIFKEPTEPEMESPKQNKEKKMAGASEGAVAANESASESCCPCFESEMVKAPKIAIFEDLFIKLRHLKAIL